MDIRLNGAGEAIFKGLTKFTGWIVTYISIGLFVGMIVSAFTGGFDKDDTYPMDGRSGFRLYIDNRTGCHYLGARQGGMTPRLDGNGHQKLKQATRAH